MFGQIVLQYPEYLWSVPVAVALILVLKKLRRRTFVAFPLTGMLAPKMFRASRLRHAPMVVAAAALPLIALALTQPVLPYAEGSVTSRGLDIVLVLDLSISMQEMMGSQQAQPRQVDLFNPAQMLAQPVKITRLETTKRALNDFIDRRPDDRIGFVVFSENAYLISPLTFDHPYLKQYVSLIDEKILPGEAMTAIGEGISLASTLLARQKTGRVSGNQVIVVFTDGEQNFGVDPIKMIEEADDVGTRVHVVAVDLNEVIKKRPAVMDLMNAVRRHGGQYFNADTVGELRQASMTIDKLEKGWLVTTQYTRNLPVYHYFAIPAIILLTAALLLQAIPYFIDFT